MRICGIYKITNPNGRIYVGQSINIKWRFSNYRRLDSCVKSSPKVYRSLKKYGYEKHSFEIIEECEKSELNEKERYYQELFNACSDFNLNCVLTNTIDKKKVSRPISEKQKRQISLAHKGKIVSNETREKLRIARAKQVITDEHRRKISENSGAARIVLDTNTGVYYNSAKELSNLYNIKHNTMVCRLSGKVVNNTQFKYV